MSADRRIALAAVALALLSLPSLTRIALTVPNRAPLDRNEGWNAYGADRVGASQPLYPDPPRFFANNYPPLSFYAVTLVPTSNRVAAGRALSFTAFMAWALLLAATARRMRCSKAEAAFGGALFMALMLAMSSYVGTNDPQFLGHAPQALGLFLLVSSPRTLRRVLAAAVLLAAGVFTKLNLVALPLALTVWLLATDRRAGIQLLAAGAACAVGGAILCIWLYGTGFISQLFMPRDYSPRDTLRATLLWLVRMPVFLALLALLARRGRHDAAAMLIAIYAAIATPLGLWLFGGAGVDWNVLFDANAACCLAAAVGLNRLAAERRPFVAVACVLLPAAAAVASARADWWSRAYWLAPRSGEVVEADREVEFVRRHAGPAFCTDLTFCWRAGKPAEVDTFGVEQRGRRDASLFDELAILVERQYYDVIQVGTTTLPFGSRFAIALQQRYVVDHQGRYGAFLVRRRLQPL